MRPSARVQAAIDLLDEIIASASEGGAPADRLIASYFKTRRYAGSKDRRAVRELVYSAIRACGPVPEHGRAAMLRLAEVDTDLPALFDGSDHSPPPIREHEKAAKGGIAPQWLTEELAKSDIAGDEAEALLSRAPLDIRVNTLKASRETPDLPEKGEMLTAPNAMRYPSGTPVEQWDAYSSGTIEIQDHGSQIACMATGVEPGQNVLDLCAGAGGKTLAMAALMGGKGRIAASDTDKRRLGNLMPRACKAGVDPMIAAILLDPGKEMEALASFAGQADHVVIDAPCSSTGTWRRNPEARWRMTPNGLDKLTELQARLIDIGTKLVKPGGRLTYITCSMLDAEGRDQIAAALDRHPNASPAPLDLPLGRTRGHGTRLTPFHDDTDGFFIAQLHLA